MKKNRIRRSDYNRVLITETTPFETPIIFSNDGLYDQIAALDSIDDIQRVIIKALVLGEGIAKPPNSTIPYTYKIKKDSKDFRRLALLHPASQWKVRIFYEKYEQLIIHYCSISPASIRAPRRVAGSFYSKSSWENINRYKNGAVALDGLDKYVKHAPSYFSYRGYDRLYKFFDSRNYLELEKRFAILRTLDVSKCFDSIYTHCLSWAVKDKAFTKAHISTSSFAQEFDEVIRHGNHNETNGIPIGPEVSRIFAEIIFQEVDQRVIKALVDLKFQQDYDFRRYVDDVFIFARNEAIAKRIYDKYADVLIEFNLHTNTAKSTCISRPFSSSKARLVHDAGQHANFFFEKFLDQTENGVLSPKVVHNSWKLAKSYIDSVKALCHANEATYDEIASFLISVITERIKRLVNYKEESLDIAAEERYVDAFAVLLDVLFFLYSVAPSVGASYKLSTSVILVARFSKQHLANRCPTVHQKIFDLTCLLLHDQCGVKHAGDIDGFVHLESFNIALAIRELGDDYLLPPEVIDELFVSAGRLTYFTIVASLFYVRDVSKYQELRNTLLAAAAEKLSDLSDILMNSEKANLLLDLLSCPYVPKAQKTSWTKNFHKDLQLPVPSKAKVQTFLTSASASHAQVDWKDIDLLNSLEKRELKQAY